MPPTGPSLTILSWTPTKKKFKPLTTKKPSPDMSGEDDKSLSLSSWSGIHSDSDTEWPPLSHSLSSSASVTAPSQTWPQQPTSTSKKDRNNDRTMHQTKFGSISIN